MTLDKKLRTAIICELKTYARPSDQRIADKMGVSRGTVWNKRHEMESDIVAYLGRDFINFRVKLMNRSLMRLENQYDCLEELKDSTNTKLVRNAAVDAKMNKVIPFVDIKHIPISASDKIRIIKEQVKIERMINGILTSGMLQAANLTPIIDDPGEI